MKANLPSGAACAIDYSNKTAVYGELQGALGMTTRNALHVTRWRNADRIELWTSRGRSIILSASDFRKFIDAMFQDAPTQEEPHADHR